MVIGLPRKCVLNIQKLKKFSLLSIPLRVELYDDIRQARLQ